MTQSQLDALEFAGLSIVLIAVAVAFNLELLLLVFGVAFVIIGNTGKAHNGDSP